MHRAKPRTIQNTSENRPSQKRSTAYNGIDRYSQRKEKLYERKVFCVAERKTAGDYPCKIQGVFPKFLQNIFDLFFYQKWVTSF